VYDLIQDSLTLKLTDLFGTKAVYAPPDSIMNTLANKREPEVETFLPYLSFWRNSTSFAWSRPGIPLNMAQVRSGANIAGRTEYTIDNIKMIACDFLYSIRIYAQREDDLNAYERIFYITKINNPLIEISLLSKNLRLPVLFGDEITKSSEESGDMTKETFYYFDSELTVQGFIIINYEVLKETLEIRKSIYDLHSGDLIEREIIESSSSSSSSSFSSN